jgi:hypothetical protein
LKKKPKPGQTDRFRFGSVFREKTGLARFSSFCLVFSDFGLVFSVLALFFWVLARFGSVFFGFGSVRFFQFFAYKTEPAGFFKIF